MKNNTNPFSEKSIAQIWSKHVEGKDMIRDAEIYPLIRKTFGHKKIKTILEVGCGQGECSKCISKDVVYTGIDSSEELIKRACIIQNTVNRSFIVADAVKLPFINQAFDAVFSVNVLFHICDIKSAVYEMARVLISGGRFLLVTANSEVFLDWRTLIDIKKETREYVRGIFNISEHSLSDFIFYKHSNTQIKEICFSCGLRIESQTFIGKNEHLKNNMFIVFEGYKL